MAKDPKKILLHSIVFPKKNSDGIQKTTEKERYVTYTKRKRQIIRHCQIAKDNLSIEEKRRKLCVNFGFRKTRQDSGLTNI